MPELDGNLSLAVLIFTARCFSRLGVKFALAAVIKFMRKSYINYHRFNPKMSSRTYRINPYGNLDDILNFKFDIYHVVLQKLIKI